MVIRKQNKSNHEEGKKISSLTTLKRMVTILGETQHGPSQIPPNIRLGKKMEKDWNNQIRRSQER